MCVCVCVLLLIYLLLKVIELNDEIANSFRFAVGSI